MCSSFIFGLLKNVSSKHNLPYTLRRFPTYTCKSRIIGINTNVVIKRTFMGNNPSNSIEAKFKELDGIPEKFKLIYRSNFERYIKYSYLVACATTGTILGALIYKFDIDKSGHSLENPIFLSNEHTMGLILLVVAFVAIQTLVRQVPFRIYNMPSKKEYILVFNGTVPMTIKQTKCLRGDVVKVDTPEYISAILPWLENKYQLNKSQTLILFEDSFKRPIDLSILLGEEDE